jgi:hypothetical protein
MDLHPMSIASWCGKKSDDVSKIHLFESVDYSNELIHICVDHVMNQYNMFMSIS